MTSQQKESDCRAEHCFFKILNVAGRCIAYCHWNIDYEHDCIGRSDNFQDRNTQEIQILKTKI